MSEPAAVLWIDSDVATNKENLRKLSELSRRKNVELVVSAQVHLEQCRQMRQWCRQNNKRYAASLMTSFLKRLQINQHEVRFGFEEAERWGEILDEHFPGPDDWRSAKLQCVKARLPEGVELPAERVPMTTDWLTALMVSEREHFAVVEDKGPEWRWLRSATPKRAMSFHEVMVWLEALPEPQPEPPA